MWVWKCEMCCNRLQCKHSRPECFENILVGQRHWPWKAYVQGRRRTHRFFLQQDDSQIQSSGPTAQCIRLLLRLPGWKINLTWNQDFRRHWLPNWLFNKNSFRSTRSTSGPWFRFSRPFEPAISRVNSRTVLVRWFTGLSISQRCQSQSERIAELEEKTATGEGRSKECRLDVCWWVWAIWVPLSFSQASPVKPLCKKVND